MATAFLKLPRARQIAIAAARQRKRTTPAEHEFLLHLESLGVGCRYQQAFNHPHFRIVDFYLPDHNLVIEIDGPYHDAERDRLRDEAFTKARGIRVSRLTNDEVMSGNFQLPCTIGVRPNCESTENREPTETAESVFSITSLE